VEKKGTKPPEVFRDKSQETHRKRSIWRRIKRVPSGQSDKWIHNIVHSEGFTLLLEKVVSGLGT
jgi:hypothetical protein